MGTVIDIIIDGFKKFGGEIIAGILLTVALWFFPGLRKLFNKHEEQSKLETEAEIQKQLKSLILPGQFLTAGFSEPFKAKNITLLNQICFQRTTLGVIC